jgi:DNA-binding transcriptional regulator YiaG
VIDCLELGRTMSTTVTKHSSVIEKILVEEVYSEGRVAATVAMRRNPRTGELSYTASAVRTLDRLRAILVQIDERSSSGHVKTLRESLGLTQQELADRLKVTSQTISRWERGEVQPSAEVLKKLRRLQLSARKRGVTVRTGAPRHRPEK